MKNKKMVVITMAFLIVTLVLMCYKFVTGNYNEGFTCILALVLLVLPSIVDRKTKLCLPGGLQISILVFVF